MPTQRPTTIRLRASLLEDANAIVERDFASDLSLDDIARRVASSRRQLQRAYAEIGETTFRDHLTEVRMQRAAELLERGRLTVREVAHRVGYRQPAQFAKAFRRHRGVAPSDFRAVHRRVCRSRPRRHSAASAGGCHRMRASMARGEEPMSEQAPVSRRRRAARSSGRCC